MVDIEKVRLMTEAAVIEKKEERKGLRVILFRKSDYIRLHTLLVLLSVSVAYLIGMAGIFTIVVVSNDRIILNLREMILILICVFVLYLLVLVGYSAVCRQYYGHKYHKAYNITKKYMNCLSRIKKLVDEDSEE